MTSQEHDNAPHTMRGSEAAQGPHFGPGRLGLVALIAGIVAIGGCRTDESTAGITLVAAGILAMAFLGFTGVDRSLAALLMD